MTPAELAAALPKEGGLMNERHTPEPIWTLDDPRVQPRVITCVNALSAVDDPAAFMADVRELVEGLAAHYQRATINALRIRVAAHLPTEGD